MLQVPGPVAIQNSAVPPLDPGATYAVNNIYAYVGTAPATSTAIGLTVTVQGQPYCMLSIPAGSTQSTPVDGSTLVAASSGSSDRIECHLGRRYNSRQRSDGRDSGLSQ